MLLSLHVKNLALIEEEEIEFENGLNILTGETGAGKSIILGALSLALGAKVDKAMLRNDEDAFVEAVFKTCDAGVIKRLEEMDISPDDGEIILSRRITSTRTSAKLNGESVPAKLLAEVGGMLLDIYGQQEHVSLLKKSRHLYLLDEYAADELSDKKLKLAEEYNKYRHIEKEYEASATDSSDREKELLFLLHETKEIEEAKLTAGEDEKLESEYRRLSNARRIMESVSAAYQAIDQDGASNNVSRALREISQAAEFDPALSDIESILSDAEGLLSDAIRDMSAYCDEAGFNDERFAEVEERVNTINSLKSKYGQTIEEILSVYDEKNRRIDELNNYDSYLEELKKRRIHSKEIMEELSQEISVIRQNAAGRLCEEVSGELSDLNFLNVDFGMHFDRLNDYSSNGYDDAWFEISLNPGTPPAPLADIASGGELSRIMLALKTVLARTDAVDTLIFDEIDAGISGRTAQAVAAKLDRVSGSRQVICITHLPQIAAFADRHFRIEKHLESDSTISAIHPLDTEGRVEELARMLGGAEITEAVRSNARELIEKAK